VVAKALIPFLGHHFEMLLANTPFANARETTRAVELTPRLSPKKVRLAEEAERGDIKWAGTPFTEAWLPARCCPTKSIPAD